MIVDYIAMNKRLFIVFSRVIIVTNYYCQGRRELEMLLCLFPCLGVGRAFYHVVLCLKISCLDGKKQKGIVSSPFQYNSVENLPLARHLPCFIYWELLPMLCTFSKLHPGWLSTVILKLVFFEQLIACFDYAIPSSVTVDPIELKKQDDYCKILRTGVRRRENNNNNNATPNTVTGGMSS